MYESLFSLGGYEITPFSLAVFLAGLAGCAVCGFSVGIFWPGTFSLAAKALKGGGTALYAFLALAGDVGCSGGPTVVGFVANAFSDQLKAGLAAAIVFPTVMLLAAFLWRKQKP